jgi:imidazolonepropionase-like amidohydrolase
MRWFLIGSLLAACSSTTAPRAPSGAAKVLAFEVITAGRHAGEGEIRIEPDGRRLTHFTFNDRGRGPDVRTEMTLDDAGRPRTFKATGHDYLKAPVDERLEARDGKLWWTSTSEHGDAAGGFYIAQNEFDVTLARALLRAKDHRVAVLPAGEARLEEDTPREFEIAGVKHRLHRVAIAGLGFQPATAWLDQDNEFFASVSPWTSTIRAGAASAIPALIADDEAWTTARAGKLAQLAHRPPAAGLAFTHAQLFDSERRTLVPDQTVIVVGDRITAVGDARTPIPAGAQVIDAHGRTLIPGLWDMHVHLGDLDGAMDLASGITTVRDLGNDVANLTARMARYEAGTELGPNLLRAGLIDGPGPFAAPTGVLAETPEQATAAVAKFADAGYQQIKMYSSLKPALVPVIAAAAHARHMRVSGHIPNGMNAAQAVEGGYDEIQHVNMLFLRFLASPQDDTRTPVRFTKVAEHATELDLAGPEVQQFFDLLVAHKTVLDPTLATFDAMFTTDAGELDPVIAPYAKRLPAQIVRGAYGGGLPAPGAKRAQYRASYAAMLRMVKAAWDRKIPIVAGTDNIAGLSLPHELELYVQAGIPAPDVLALATIGAARVMGVDRETGSITVGKRADLALIEGDPTRDIAAVRNTRSIVCRGRLYDAAELFTGVGMRP